MESGANIRQVTIEQHKDRIEVEEIIRRQKLQEIKQMLKKKRMTEFLCYIKNAAAVVNLLFL